MGKFTWFLIGGALGAGAALAFAPQTGEETRALVAEKANAFAGEAKDFGAGLPGSAQDLLNTARDQGTSLLKGTQDKASGLANDASAKVAGAAGKASDADADELRAKIEAARQRIAAQVMENAEKDQAALADTNEAAVEKAESVAEEAEIEAKHAAK